ncbi:MAG: amino acid permease [Neisseriaceae bacterium]|nr:amino acid permease [Neisseriaceae bacterium]MBP6862543.1 amino acid permease [Neisseriaceae bacterium]
MTTNKVFGSTLIIAGTTIGAGMLALPLASAGIGFWPASLIMCGIWLLMTYTAMLMLEVHQHAPVNATLHTLAHQFLGKKGRYLATFAVLFLFYALCAAYIAGGGSQFNDKINAWFNVQQHTWGTVFFTVAVALVVSIGTHSVDMVNRLLFTLKIIALVIMLSLLMPHVKAENLMAMPMQQGLLISSLPVIFTSFGFHGSIPSVVQYVGKDIKALRKIMIFGSALPLMVYLLWQVAIQGIFTQTELFGSASLSQFMTAISQSLQTPMVNKAVIVFADLALATSFLGVSLGLFDFIADSLNRNRSSAQRLQVAVITFVPPLGFALFYPQGFITALGYAAIALTILAIFLPVAMVWAKRQQMPAGDDYVVKGGKAALIVVFALGCVIIASQLLQMIGLIPAVG